MNAPWLALVLSALQIGAPAAKPARAPGLYATFDTSMGTIVCVLFEKEAPIAVQNFVGLARGTKEWTDPKTKAKTRRPLYNGTIFHRVIPQFMIQGGDPLGTGFGDPGYTIKDEISPGLLFDRPGRLAMARTAQPNTGGSQFFITEAPYPSLNNGYTIFGQVVEGQELVKQIAAVPREANDRPKTPVVLKTVRITRVPAASTAPAKKTATPAKKTAK